MVELRGKMDAHMDVADDELDSYQNALVAVLQFEHCMLPQSSLMQAHVRSQHARSRARKHLEETWRHSTRVLERWCL